MENIFSNIISERGDVVAGVVAFLVIIAGLVLKKMGNPLLEKTSPIADPQIAALSQKVGGIDARLRSVETHVDHLPTRVELHQIQLQIVGLDGKMVSLEKTGNASAASLARMEDHLYTLARDNK
uniref:DUF2730 family protein n=1 Tax=Yoonia sp. TaxID=2212373 RepID=UPI004047F5DA